MRTLLNLKAIPALLVLGSIAACGGGGAPPVPAAPVSMPTTPSNGSVTIFWTAPSQYTDGTTLNNLSGYTIYQGTTSSYSSLRPIATLDNPSVMTFLIENLSAGDYYVAVTAIDDQNIESTYSDLLHVTIN